GFTSRGPPVGHFQLGSIGRGAKESGCHCGDHCKLLHRLSSQRNTKELMLQRCTDCRPSTRKAQSTISCNRLHTASKLFVQSISKVSYTACRSVKIDLDRLGYWR